jgi:putative ABC transport system ATP-binding protein
VQILNNINLQIKQGEIVAVTGSSGGGKSTLLNIIGTLDKASSGNVCIAGQNTSSLSDRKLSELRNATVGFVFQFFYLQPFMTVAQNVETALMPSRSKTKKRSQKILSVLELVGMEKYESYYPRQLSGGQLQRVAIARALVNNPKIILADEPTGNLDSINSGKIMDVLCDARESLDTTIVLITHDQAIASRADRILKLSDGVLR